MPSGSIVACDSQDDDSEDQLDDTGVVESLVHTNECIIDHLKDCCNDVVNGRSDLKHAART